MMNDQLFTSPDGEGILLSDDADLSGCVETSRVTVNTHTSLLEHEDEDEEEDEEVAINTSFVSNSSMDRPETPPPALQCRPCCSNHKGALTTTPKDSILEQMTESFVDSFCFSESKDPPSRKRTKSLDKNLSWEDYSQAAHSDLVHMLGWVTLPSLPEMKFLWTGLFCDTPLLLDQLQKRPQRHSYRQRALKVRRLRQERGDFRASPVSVVQTRSFDIRVLHHNDLDKHIGHGLEPILPNKELELGYDSDPDDIPFLQEASIDDSSDDEDYGTASPRDILMLVQEAFNQNWKLKLHPLNGANPVAVEAWLEKGTLIQQSPVMLEPCLMWRKPGDNTPHRIRLLNICRILPMRAKSADHPYARPRRSMTLRTAEDDQSYVLEASSESSLMDVMMRWKHCVARFAMLAVMEDVQTIQKEFFRKSPTSRMLVPDYNEDNEY